MTPSGSASVFARGLDAGLWSITRDSGVWGSWTREGAALSSDPVAVCDPSGKIWVFLRGSDNGVYTFSPGGTFTNLNLGQNATSDPTAVVDSSGRELGSHRGKKKPNA